MSDLVERLKAGFESEEPQEYCHNEVTGLHNMADLYEIERLNKRVAELQTKGLEVCAAFMKEMVEAEDEIELLQTVVDAAIAWANTDKNDIDGCDKTNLELLDAVGEYLYDTSKRDVLQKAYIAAREGEK